MPKDDSFFTKKHVARACLDHWAKGILHPLPEVVNILEPSYGTGVWVKEFLPIRHLFVGNKHIKFDLVDINNRLSKLSDIPQSMFTAYHENFLDWKVEKKYNFILGNPPYSLAEEFLTKSLTHLAEHGHAGFLLRLGFLASLERSWFWRTFPAYKIYVLRPRPSFLSNGRTDGTEYAFFTWYKELGAFKVNHTQIDWITYKKPSRLNKKN